MSHQTLSEVAQKDVGYPVIWPTTTIWPTITTTTTSWRLLLMLQVASQIWDGQAQHTIRTTFGPLFPLNGHELR